MVILQQNIQFSHSTETTVVLRGNILKLTVPLCIIILFCLMDLSENEMPVPILMDSLVKPQFRAKVCVHAVPQRGERNTIYGI